MRLVHSSTINCAFDKHLYRISEGNTKCVQPFVSLSYPNGRLWSMLSFAALSYDELSNLP